ncbi:hypothetical protein T03_7448 [Trichinella britovi]|uniref:Uncharacterized protein n=1 Tax=Trichinella britovi TaxID=45882 RepID=A0A0V1D3K2_TRIBR|nr:hypothetical protein T03_7448 [Trichinella britovi]
MNEIAVTEDSIEETSRTLFLTAAQHTERLNNHEDEILQIYTGHVVFSGKSDNRNPSNYEGVEESKYNLQFLLKQIGSKLIQFSIYASKCKFIVLLLKGMRIIDIVERKAEEPFNHIEKASVTLETVKAPPQVT